jgi:hypothetical protein
MRVKILEIGKPTISGNIYSEEVVVRALANWSTHMETRGKRTDIMPIFKETTTKPLVEDIVGFATDIKIEDGYLTADVGLYKHLIDPIIPEGEHINIRPNSIGTIKDGVVQDDFRMNGFAIVRKKT